MSTFTNSLGQVIEPGDKVVVIASGYNHSINVRPGTFVGMSPAGSPQVRVNLDVYRWTKPDGTTGKYEEGSTYKKHSVERVSTYWAGRVFRLA